MHVLQLTAEGSTETIERALTEALEAIRVGETSGEDIDYHFSLSEVCGAECA